jgi:hypothetical protein
VRGTDESASGKVKVSARESRRGFIRIGERPRYLSFGLHLHCRPLNFVTMSHFCRREMVPRRILCSVSGGLEIDPCIAQASYFVNRIYPGVLCWKDW